MDSFLFFDVRLYVFYFHSAHSLIFFFFFFNDTATTEIYTLSLHDALPIWNDGSPHARCLRIAMQQDHSRALLDRKSTRLNSSHEWISYAVFCLKKKKQKKTNYKNTKTI